MLSIFAGKKLIEFLPKEPFEGIIFFCMVPSFIHKSQIPPRPGVYIFKDKNGKVLYVGKAIDLYHRVSSYFNRRQDNPKTAVLVANIVKLDTIEVASELEALILEANLIKKYLPPYNIRLTDDKDYLYIKITKEKFPRIFTARKNELADAKDFFGPFPSSGAVRTTLKRLRRFFPWCMGTRYSRPCFYYHLGLCPGACAGKISQEDYHKIIKRFVSFLEGKKDEVIKDLTQEMEESSKNLEFEKALRVKRILTGIVYLTQSNKADVYLENPNFLDNLNSLSLKQLQKDLRLLKSPKRIECFDISNLGGETAVGSLVVLTCGEIDKRWYRKFRIRLSNKPNDVAMLKEVLSRRINHEEWPIANLILIDGGRAQVRMAESILSQNGWKIPVFGLAKRLEWLYTPGQEIIKLSKSSLSLRLLQKIRDEAHRVAINYHRKLRDKKLLYNIH